MLKSKLITISRTNLLYLPQIVNNTVAGLASNATNNILTVLVDETTVGSAAIKFTGAHIDGYRMGDNNSPIVMDQGIKSNAIGNGDSVLLDSDLTETQFMIEIDNRFGKIWNGDGDAQATPSFVDDDNVATYYISKGNANGNSKYFGDSGTNMSGDVIAGPRGNRLRFLVGPSVDLNSSTYLFTQLGTTSTLGGVNVYQIDTTVRISGVTTGYRVDLPIRFVKKQ
tara:strand:- start:36 stop:710 length:675 start_codon:yes stop_codon:yes gene_type:complete